MASEIKEKLLSIGLLWLRMFVGLGAAHHGFGKVFGGHIDQFAIGVGQMGFPMPIVFAWAAALSEFLGGILLVLGLGTRFAGFFVFFTMAVAFFIHHKADPLDVKELAAAYGVVAGALVMTGPGCLSLDHLLTGKGKK